MAKIRLTNQVNPTATPASGTSELYFDSTSKTLESIDDAGAVVTYTNTPNATSTTDNALVRWDGANSPSQQDSSVLLDDSDDMTGLAGLTFVDASTKVDGVLDEDAMGTDSATKLATQQSIKAYVDSQVSGAEVWWHPANTEWKVDFDDFISNTSSGYSQSKMGHYGYTSGSGAIIGLAANPTADPAWGCLRTRSPSSTGYSNYTGNYLGQMPGEGAMRCGFRIKTPTIADATNDYTQRIGYNNSTTVVGAYHCYFLLDRAQNATNFLCVTDDNVTENINDSGIAFDTAWHTFEVLINAGATSCKFYIDGVEVHDQTSALPSGAGRAMGSQFSQNYVAGATRDTYHDWRYEAFKPDAVRGVIAAWMK